MRFSCCALIGQVDRRIARTRDSPSSATIARSRSGRNVTPYKEIKRTAIAKNSITGSPSIADRPGFQISLAQMEAQLNAARAWFYEMTEAIWNRCLAGDEVPQEQVAMLRIACTHIAKVGADVARRAFELSGTTGIFNQHPLSRLMLDAIVVGQHAFMNDSTWQSGGGMLVGKSPPPGYP